jgi:hypothetical protein
MQTCAAHYALTYVSSPKLQLFTWTVVGPTVTEFKLFQFQIDCCWASPAQSFLIPGPAGPMVIFFCLPTLTELWDSAHNLRSDLIDNTASNSLSIVACVFIAAGICLPSWCLAVDVSTALHWLHYSGFRASCHSIFSWPPGIYNNAFQSYV